MGGSLKTLLNLISTITPTDRTNLLAAVPQDIARLTRSCFLAPPIQLPVVTTAIRADSSPAMYDRRENQYRSAMQVNVKSLAAWNRDGQFADFNSENRMTADTVNSSQLINAFNSTSGNTRGMAYIPSPLDNTASPMSLSQSGMGAKDQTDSGLIFYSSVIENGSIPIDPVTRRRDYTVTPLFPGLSTTPAIVINDGESLPGAFTLATDRAAYVQGNWNTIDKYPSAIMSDTFTLLSNKCVSDTVTNLSGSNYRFNCIIRITNADKSRS